ncbi:MAG: PhnD/SsuA/transferrin family substrate-binding protein, partial [Candidatus Aminicenantes bacterium]|nr:PhnD/SsuA/transferrin family substrate-binding protein [Candidatus Aminicenantes bacterium]
MSLEYKRSAAIILIFFSILFTTDLIPVESMTIGVHAYDRKEVLEKKFTPLAEYLSEKTGKDFKLYVSESYVDHITKVGNDLYDISFMGPIGYVTMVRSFGKKEILAILGGEDSQILTGRIIVNKKSDIYKLSEIKIDELAFVDIRSTMGFVIPFHQWLIENKMDNNKAMFKFLGSHYNVVTAVLSGDIPAGAVKEETYQKYCKNRCRVIYTCPEVTDHCFIASDKIKDPLLNNIKTILLEMSDNENGVSIIKNIRTDLERFVSGA